MATPRDEPTDLAFLERALDSEQYSFLNPSTASATSSELTSARGEFSMTPSAARVSSTRNDGRGVNVERGIPAKLVFITKRVRS